jgi:hypothetical protein
MGIQPKTFGGLMASPYTSSQQVSVSLTSSPSTQTFNNNQHIIPDQPKPKVVRKPTAAGALGVQKRAFEFGAGAKPSPSPTKQPEKNQGASRAPGQQKAGARGTTP